VADDGIGVGSDFDIRRDEAIGMQSVIAIADIRPLGFLVKPASFSRLQALLDSI